MGGNFDSLLNTLKLEIGFGGHNINISVKLNIEREYPINSFQKQLSESELIAHYTPIEWNYIDNEGYENLSFLTLSTNYYDSNSENACSIGAEISLE